MKKYFPVKTDEFRRALNSPSSILLAGGRPGQPVDAGDDHAVGRVGRGRSGPLGPQDPDALGQVPLGELLPVPGAAQDQRQGRVPLPRHRAEELQVLPQVREDEEANKIVFIRRHFVAI